MWKWLLNHKHWWHHKVKNDIREQKEPTFLFITFYVSDTEFGVSYMTSHLSSVKYLENVQEEEWKIGEESLMENEEW